LEGIGITSTRTKAAINGGLQVSPRKTNQVALLTSDCSVGILPVP
jgi:hypothetical protein